MKLKVRGQRPTASTAVSFRAGPSRLSVPPRGWAARGGLGVGPAEEGCPGQEGYAGRGDHLSWLAPKARHAKIRSGAEGRIVAERLWEAHRRPRLRELSGPLPAKPSSPSLAAPR